MHTSVTVVRSMQPSSGAESSLLPVSCSSVLLHKPTHQHQYPPSSHPRYPPRLLHAEEVSGQTPSGWEGIGQTVRVLSHMLSIIFIGEPMTHSMTLRGCQAKQLPLSLFWSDPTRSQFWWPCSKYVRNMGCGAEGQWKAQGSSFLGVRADACLEPCGLLRSLPETFAPPF